MLLLTRRLLRNSRLPVRSAALQCRGWTRASSSHGERGPLAAYEDLVATRSVEGDDHQRAALAKLDALYHRIVDTKYAPPPLAEAGPEQQAEKGGLVESVAEWARGFGLALGGGSERPSGAGGPEVSRFGAPAVEQAETPSLFSWGKTSGKPQAGKKKLCTPPKDAPQGIYLYGGVGTGKTFMMDMFFECVPVKKKRRVHFNSFMLDVHSRLHRLTSEAKKDPSKDPRRRGIEPIEVVVRELLEEGWLICFDEFQVTDIADAMLLKQLFTSLLEKGAVVVATSNRPPNDLYKNGIQRDLFLPFIDLLNSYFAVHSIEDSKTDYRLMKSADAAADTYFISGAPGSRDQFEALYRKLGKSEKPYEVKLKTQGRTVVVPRAAIGSRVARFSFAELCGRPVGAADYLAIASAFPTVFLEDIPRLKMKDINQIRRFIVLIDNFYEAGVKLICMAEAEPHLLFDADGAAAGGGKEISQGQDQFGDQNHGDLIGDARYLQKTHDEIFAFDRTVSRLREMQSKAYLKQAGKVLTGTDLLSTLSLEHDLLDEATIKQVWDAYDVDRSHHIDRDELEAMMQDLMEISRGHRNVTSQLIDATYDEMDVDRDGRVDFDEFLSFTKKRGLFVWAEAAEKSAGHIKGQDS